MDNGRRLVILFILSYGCLIVYGAIDYYEPFKPQPVEFELSFENQTDDEYVWRYINEALNESGNPDFVKSVTYLTNGTCSAYIRNRADIVVYPCDYAHRVLGYRVNETLWIKFVMFHEIAHGMFNTDNETQCNEYAINMLEDDLEWEK